ncbi:MAG: nucleoside-diphosphate kinase [Candidatus Thermoplasmatota archaeon]|nr:nucleoside-diphosphate kinase [Candidatus Thermoplasmatota archaeon]
MRERIYIMVKPDGVQRGLVGDVISRIETKGYKLSAIKMLRIDVEKASVHYREHIGKPFFDDLVKFITSGPVVAMVVEGENAVDGIRAMMGMTNPRDSVPGTIRGDFGINLSRNVIHGSDSPESARREISLFFDDEEIMDYERIDEIWLYPDE